MLRIIFYKLYHFSWAFGSALRYRFPSRFLTVIGITGTKGKTSTVELLHAVLSANDTMVASTSSLRFRIGERITSNNLKMSMPGRMFLQSFLARAVAADCRYAVLEVTSQGIIQFRHRFIRFRTAAMTNLAPEHLEAHGGFEPYMRAKLDLFWRLPKFGVAVINKDDPHKDRFAAATAARIVWYGKDGIFDGDTSRKVERLTIDDDGIRFTLGGVQFSSPLKGAFNFSNIMAAVAIGLTQGIALESMARAIGTVAGVEGRMEYVQTSPFGVIVDYAHTPDSIRSVYETLRPEAKRLICVLGATGGGRDTWKRPEFGKIAGAFCDEIILTDEDPYDEDPNAIVEQVKEGVRLAGKEKQCRTVMDRREAIKEALVMARPGDCVIMTGKGAEPWMMGLNGSKIPWDERQICREELNVLAKKKS